MSNKDLFSFLFKYRKIYCFIDYHFVHIYGAFILYVSYLSYSKCMFWSWVGQCLHCVNCSLSSSSFLKTVIMNWLQSWKLIVTILISMRGLNSKKILRTTKSLHEFNRDSYAEVQGSKLKSVCTDNFDFTNLSMIFFSLMSSPCALDL